MRAAPKGKVGIYHSCQKSTAACFIICGAKVIMEKWFIDVLGPPLGAACDFCFPPGNNPTFPGTYETHVGFCLCVHGIGVRCDNDKTIKTHS